MARTLFMSLLLSLLFKTGTAQTILFPGLEEEELQVALRTAYRPATTLSLADAKDTLYGIIDNMQDSVEGIYSGYTLYLPPGQDASIWLYMNGSGINLEHVYPQSKGADEGMPGHSNMHHLYPSRVAVNSARASHPFADIPDSQTATWYRNNTSMQNIPSSNIDEYSEYINGAFEPRESVKGNIARAVFYFYTMYQEDADAADPAFFPAQRQTLCQWHIDDPIDQTEVLRSTAIAQYQDNKENPFVLDCSAVIRAWCPEFEECETSAAEFPNKPVMHISAHTEGAQIIVTMSAGDNFYGRFALLDIQGRLISAQAVSAMPGTSQYLLHGTFAGGIYTILLQSGEGSKIHAMTRCVIP